MAAPRVIRLAALAINTLLWALIVWAVWVVAT